MRMIWAVIVTALLAVTTACSHGERRFIEVKMPDGERATIVAHNRQVPIWLDPTNQELNFLVKGGTPTRTQLDAVLAATKACRQFTETVHPDRWVDLFAAMGIFGAAGAAGGGIGSLAFPAADAWLYAAYGGASGGLFGGAWKAITLSGNTYTFENCGREVMSLFPNYGVRVLMQSPY